MGAGKMKRKIVTKKIKVGEKSDFDREFWKNANSNEKFSAAWQLMVDAMIIKGTPEKLEFRKIIRIKTLDGKIIKEINLENPD